MGVEKGTISIRLVSEALAEFRRAGGDDGPLVAAAGLAPELFG